ncbi:MAG TPA: FG-GAP-like repeat-containing protein [Candidatus Dormibacteraeota bacterium]|jgi:Tfp pilus assembly protein PilF|nr:FG-GAP-like repeat-containing protein [Candidatus Dormibacteraeota bacterium]
MGMRLRRAGLILAVAAVLLVCALSAKLRAENGRRTEAAGQTAKSSSDSDAAKLNSVGVAYMGQQRFADAQKEFEAALAADGKYTLAKLNLGIALIAQQKSEAARAALTEATEKRPNDPYGWYNLGLVLKDIGELEKSIAAFEHVTQIAPNEPDAYYFIGYLNGQLQRYDAAIAAYQKAIDAFEFHASAQFGIARAYQRKGDADSAKIHLQRFQKITAGHLGAPFGAGYGDQGKFSVAEYAANAVPMAPAAIPVKFVAQPIAASGATSAIGPGTGACFLDFDGDGKPDLFLVSATAEGTSRLLKNLGDGKFADVTEASGLKIAGSGLGCAAGDFDNDGKTDLAVCYTDGVRLFHNDGGGKFADVTQTAGIKRDKGCVALTFVDYDHDGDLDLYVTNAPGSATGNVLWRNNSNGTFTDVSGETRLGAEATGAGLVTSDFNNDRAIDFVLAGGTAGELVLLNPREGAFHPLGDIDFTKLGLPAAVGVVSLDFDKDGWMDLAFTHTGGPGISLWRNVDGKKLERVALPDFGWKKGWGIAAIDYDNDGWLDLVAVGEGANGGEVRLLRNLGAGKFADVTKEVGLDKVKLNEPRAIVAADLRGNGETDLVITQAGGAPVLLKSEGAAANNWMELDFKALNDNKSAIGTKVEVFAGPTYQKWEVAGASGYLGQSAPQLHVGLGNQKEADVVRLLWPTGVPQDEVKLAAKKTHTLAELDRRGSSCPILFSWNGKEYEFIADMIGPGVVGHWIAPGERDVPDPTEYLKVSAKSLKERDGKLSLRFMEPMEETVYLDQVKLLAIDHPATYDVFPNERFVSNPPFPEFRVVASHNARPPAGAWDDKGNDVLKLLSAADRKYVTDFEGLPFAGFAKLHWVELDLGKWDAAKPLRLIIDGYTDYFTATSMYAADQAGIKVIAPYVEAEDEKGNWKQVVEDMGFPAGLERTMVADLTGKIPAGTKRIRVVTNLKIYWDAIRIDQTGDARDARVQEVPLANASLAFLGYPKEIRLTPASDTTYSFSKRSMTGPYARAAGNYTRYGDVKNLLRNADDRFVVFSSGEGVKLDFDPSGLKQLPAGWVRDYFFFADGFEKDMDFYAADAFTVEPLPKHGMKPYPYTPGEEFPEDAEHQKYQLEYNTRQRSGQMPADLQYHYPKK